MKVVPIKKQSKKEQRKFYSKRRSTWGSLSPVTRKSPDSRRYNRKKEKDTARKNREW